MIIPKSSHCISPETVLVTKKPNYLASVISSETSCGLHESPWILKAQPGQQIDITVMDFNWKNNSSIKNAVADKSCSKSLGYILDMESDDVINICGEEGRIEHVYKSEGHSVQIILEPSMLHQHTFLLKYWGMLFII